jgi:hypothetical protein
LRKSRCRKCRDAERDDGSFANRAIGLGGAGNAFGATGTPGGGGGGRRERHQFLRLAHSREDDRDLRRRLGQHDHGGRAAAAKPGEPPRTIPAKPLKGPQTYKALEREVARLVSTLDPSMKFSVICFAGDVAPYKTLWSRRTTRSASGR